MRQGGGCGRRRRRGEYCVRCGRVLDRGGRTVLKTHPSQAFRSALNASSRLVSDALFPDFRGGRTRRGSGAPACCGRRWREGEGEGEGWGRGARGEGHLHQRRKARRKRRGPWTNSSRYIALCTPLTSSPGNGRRSGADDGDGERGGGAASTSTSTSTSIGASCSGSRGLVTFS